MASSNRHWPSMFKKSKTSNPHGINSSLMSTGFQRTPYTSAAGGGDERSPEPKPRWNPKPEQIRILEAIFNSGMVNPPRDEIRKIRTQLQEYGQVGDANVFYWFQNRKSRSKHKLRHLQKNKNNTDQAQQNPSSSLPQITPPNSSSSSSSDKSSPQEIILPHKLGFFSDVNNGVPNSNSPTASVNQAYFQTPNETNFQLPPPAEPFSFPMQQNGVMTTQGFYLSEFSNMIQPQQNVVLLPSLPCTTSVLLSQIMSYGTSSNKDENQDNAINNIMHHQDPQLSFCLTSTSTDPTPLPPPITNTPPVTVPSPVTQLQGVGDQADGTAKCTVFINDVAFEVPMGPFNVREAFGDGAVLFHSSGHPVLTDEWAVTLQSLQHGASYYYLI